MAFKGKPSINKRNREAALRARQQEKAQRRAERAATKAAGGPADPVLDPDTLQPLSEDEQALREFKLAMQERAEQDALERERELERKK